MTSLRHNAASLIFLDHAADHTALRRIVRTNVTLSGIPKSTELIFNNVSVIFPNFAFQKGFKNGYGEA